MKTRSSPTINFKARYGIDLSFQYKFDTDPMEIEDTLVSLIRECNDHDMAELCSAVIKANPPTEHRADFYHPSYIHHAVAAYERDPTDEVKTKIHKLIREFKCEVVLGMCNSFSVDDINFFAEHKPIYVNNHIYLANSTPQSEQEYNDLSKQLDAFGYRTGWYLSPNTINKLLPILKDRGEYIHDEAPCLTVPHTKLVEMLSSQGDHLVYTIPSE